MKDVKLSFILILLNTIVIAFTMHPSIATLPMLVLCFALQFALRYVAIWESNKA